MGAEQPWCRAAELAVLPRSYLSLPGFTEASSRGKRPAQAAESRQGCGEAVDTGDGGGRGDGQSGERMRGHRPARCRGAGAGGAEGTHPMKHEATDLRKCSYCPLFKI